MTVKLHITETVDKKSWNRIKSRHAYVRFVTEQSFALAFCPSTNAANYLRPNGKTSFSSVIFGSRDRRLQTMVLKIEAPAKFVFCLDAPSGSRSDWYEYADPSAGVDEGMCRRPRCRGRAPRR